jgi:DNA-binding CsgD family transcriptional regulator
MPDLVESQIRAGLEVEARSALTELEAQAQLTGRGWALAAAARCRGLLAPPETADAIFSEAYRLVCAQPSPFERARTELCWGERLRRDGRRVDARRHLHEAHQRFEALGAVPWAEKAARELRSSGGRASRGPRARTSELTPQQAQIATMVAEGRTNKSIANSLFLSPRTIEFHLLAYKNEVPIAAPAGCGNGAYFGASAAGAVVSGGDGESRRPAGASARLTRSRRCSRIVTPDCSRRTAASTQPTSRPRYCAAVLDW